jgi:hypothetical protein
MMLAPQQVTTVMVRIVQTPTKELNVADLIVSGLGLTGLILLGSLLIGGALGGVFVLFKRWRPQNPFNGQASQTHGLHLTAIPDSTRPGQVVN